MSIEAALAALDADGVSDSIRQGSGIREAMR